MKLRYFYKLDNKKQPIPGSNVRRKSFPGSKHQWKEILDPCCSPVDAGCSCHERFFIQLDSRNKPVDGSLIKRFSWPNMTDGVKYYELPSKSICCVTPQETIDLSVGIIFTSGAGWEIIVQILDPITDALLATTTFADGDPQFLDKLVPVVEYPQYKIRIIYTTSFGAFDAESRDGVTTIWGYSSYPETENPGTYTITLPNLLNKEHKLVILNSA